MEIGYVYVAFVNMCILICCIIREYLTYDPERDDMHRNTVEYQEINPNGREIRYEK